MDNSVETIRGALTDGRGNVQHGSSAPTSQVMGWGSNGGAAAPPFAFASCCEGWSMGLLLVMECLNSWFMKNNVMI